MHSYIIILCCILFILSIVCFGLGNSMLELLFKDF
jgi:hypothetical protein